MKYFASIMIGLYLSLVIFFISSRISSDIYKQNLIKSGETCITIGGLLDQPYHDWIVEHHKPTHYDYGHGFSGDYCPDEGYPNIPGVRGALR